MQTNHSIAPDHTAIRVALWRALHVQLDAEPHVLNDEIGAKLVGEDNWRDREDMNAEFSKAMRASIVGRARFIEDLVEEHVKQGVSQYIILGAGLDTFAQRRVDLTPRLHVFEIDQPATQAWKQKRLIETGFTIPDWLHFVPVDFEAGQSWWDQLIASRFDRHKPAVVVSTGVSMYLTREANVATLEQVASLAPGSTFAMTFMLSLEHLESNERSMMEFVMQKAHDAGTPFLSLYSPEDMLSSAKVVGFKNPRYVSAENIYQRYFATRTDGLRAGSAEAFIIAST